MMYKYETHLHTSPVSSCARAGVRESLEAYKALGYEGVFITNHFIDGNIDRAVRGLPYPEMLEYYFTDYNEALRLADEIGIRVFFGVELSYLGTDFLVYGLDPDWYRAHPQIMEMTKKEELRFMAEAGALIIQAHPFREAAYIDHIRLFPREVHGVEVINSCRTDAENEMARLYAEHYSLIPFGGTDNHTAGQRSNYSGMECRRRIESEADFVLAVKAGELSPFVIERE